MNKAVIILTVFCVTPQLSVAEPIDVENYISCDKSKAHEIATSRMLKALPHLENSLEKAPLEFYATRDDGKLIILKAQLEYELISDDGFAGSYYEQVAEVVMSKDCEVIELDYYSHQPSWIE